MLVAVHKQQHVLLEMEVTAKNFDQIVEKFPQLLENAQFLTIDTEFTGLHVDGGGTFNYFDTLHELYAVNREKACTFLAVQYGICLFEYHSKTDSYTHHAFNFYIYPRSSKRNFSCQVSCMQFLGEHGFDFNKLFLDGITYLTRDEMNAKLEKLNIRQEKLIAESPVIKVPKDQRKVVDGAMDKIGLFLTSSDKEASLPRYNSFIRRLIYQTAKEKFGSEVLLETAKDSTLRVTKGLTAEEKEKRQSDKWEEEKESIHREFGFSEIIQQIIHSGKLVIGHNVLIDLLFTVQQFLHPLPNDYDEFREMLHDLFPRLVDTKHVATASNIKDFTESSLLEVLEAFDPAEIPVVEPAAPGMGYTRGASHAHEAAYDAYVTGLSFLAMIGRIGKLNMTSVYKILPNSTLLQPFLNKLSTPRLHEIPCMDLEEKQHSPNRQNVFHIQFPQDWKQQDILNHFNDLTGFINIRWIDSTSAFIGVIPESAQKLKHIMTTKPKGKCIVTTFNDFRGYHTNGADERVANKRTLQPEEDIGEVVVPKKKTVFEVPEFE